MTRKNARRELLKKENCGTCRHAWSLGRGSNNHVRVCDHAESLSKGRCMSPAEDVCELWQPEAPRDVIKQLMRTVGAT